MPLVSAPAGHEQTLLLYSSQAASVSPQKPILVSSGHLPPRLRTHQLGTGNHSNTPEIQPVRVPTCPYRWIFRQLTIRMMLDGKQELFELSIINMEHILSNRDQHLGGPWSMLRICAIAPATRIMEGGEQSDNHCVGHRSLRDQEPSLLDSPPVVWAVDRMLAALKDVACVAPGFQAVGLRSFAISLCTFGWAQFLLYPCFPRLSSASFQ